MRSGVVKAALRLAQEGSDRLFFSSEKYEGEVKTSGQYASLGFFSGVVFEATIESELGEANIRFIADTDLSPEDIDEGVWISPEGGYHH